MVDPAIQKIIDYINSKEFFWLQDLREHMGCLSSCTKEYPLNTRIQYVVARLKKHCLITCTEVRKGNRQYFRKHHITITVEQHGTITCTLYNKINNPI